MLGQGLLPGGVGALLDVERAFGLPLLPRIVVGQRRTVECSLEIGLGVGAAEEMLAWANLADRVHCLAVFAEVIAAQQLVHLAQLVAVHHELLIAGHQPALEPAGRLQHEVGAAHHGGH